MSLVVHLAKSFFFSNKNKSFIWRRLLKFNWTKTKSNVSVLLNRVGEKKSIIYWWSFFDKRIQSTNKWTRRCIGKNCIRVYGRDDKNELSVTDTRTRIYWLLAEKNGETDWQRRDKAFSKEEKRKESFPRKIFVDFARCVKFFRLLETYENYALRSRIYIYMNYGFRKTGIFNVISLKFTKNNK